jgi:hypothetical protein
LWRSRLFQTEQWSHTPGAAPGKLGRFSVSSDAGIRVNDQSRICFTWSASGAGNVELVDYH